MAEGALGSASDARLDFDDETLKGNYQETLNDAAAAVTLQPTFINAIEKGASACVKLKRYEEATSWCDKGLVIDKNNKTLVDLRTKCLSEPDTSQETKGENMRSMPVTLTATGQSKNLMGQSQVTSPADDNLDFDDDTLKAIAQVYSKRGTVHFRLGNYQETLNDAAAAVTLQPTFIEAIENGASACVKLKRYEEATSWCDKGLAIEKNNKTLVDLRTKCVNQPDTSQETKRQNMKGTAVTHIATGQKGAHCLPKTAKDKLGVKCEEENANLRQQDFKRAIKQCEHILKNAQEVGDKAREGMAYGFLGNAYQGLGDFKTAICYHKRRLKIAKEVEDKAEKEMSYCSLGNAYSSLGDFKTAIDYHKEDLKISKEVGDKAGEGMAYGNLGNAYQSLGDFKTATDYHERHLKIAKKVGDKAGEGTAYCNLGNDYQMLGDLKTAIDYHERHLKIVKEVRDKAGEGRAYGNLGNAYRSLGDFKRAIDYHKRHLKIAKEVGHKAGEGVAYGNLGNAYRSLGDFKRAIDYHQRNLKIAKELGDKDGVKRAYGNLGNAYGSLGDFKTAIDYLEGCLKFAKDVGDKAGEGRAYGNLGRVYQNLGDFKTAIDYLERHLKIAKEVGDKAGKGGAYGNLGNAYRDLGDFKTAIDYHERHLKISKEVGDKAGEGVAHGHLGSDYLCLRDSKRAINYHERHLNIAKEVGDKAGEGRAYGNLGNAYASLGDFKTAINYHERHLNIAIEVGDKAGEGGAYGNLGNAYASLDDFKTATDYHERDLKIVKEVGDKNGTATSFFNLGKNFELQQSLPEAINCFHSSVKMFNIIRHDLKGKDDWKISYRNMYEKSYTSRWRLLLQQEEVEKALFAAEEGRAQALNDLMELNYGLERTYCQSPHLEEITQMLLSFPRSVTVYIAINEQDIVFWVVQDGKDVQLRKKKLGDKISSNLNDFLSCLVVAASRELNIRVGVKCEDRSLDKLGGEHATNERSPQTPATPVPLQMSVLRTLYDVIIDPIADVIHGDELILVPEGPLCLVPYAALLDSNSRYLCDVCRIRVIPSLTSLKLITDSPDDYHSKTGMLLVGDPWVQEVVIPGEKKLEQLPFARKEVEMIGRILNTTPLIGKVATKDEVLRRLSSVALIHIAAHGRMERGEIALAPNTTRASQVPAKEDFLLTMKDVTSSRIHARLVVLSCCHSGRGEIKAEGVVGIARAFLGAGARAVLVSLWAIDDAATLEFMKSFYTHLVNGISASESLNRAMKYLRESEEFNEVKFWAPFLLIGDDVTMELGGTEFGNCT